MSNKDQLGKIMLDIFSICGYSEEAAIELMQTVKETIEEQNKELELENEAQALAGHNKELQNDIILLMKEYGLGSGEAYELINRLSKAGNIEKIKASAPIDEAVQESGIDDVMQDVYTSGNITGVYDKDNKPPFVPIFSSGEDPGDTHEPSKSSGTPNYERILEKLGWFLDCNENLSHYSLYNEIKDILKEHQEQNKPVEYGTPKDIGNGEYAAVINPVPKYKPEPFNMYADGQTPKLFDVEHEGRAYQEMQFKDFNITFMQGDEVIKSTDIHEALQYVYLLCEGYMAHIDKRRYRMKEILMKQYPSHEVIVKVEEVKRYG